MTRVQWRRCGCVELEKLGRKPTAYLSSFQVQILQGLPDKARTYPGSRVIQVDKDRWARWSALQRQAVLEHEAAHEEDPAACEACTDARAGARMRWAGVSLDAAIDALGSAVEHRQTRESVRVGWLSAHQVMQQRGKSRPMNTGADLAPTEGAEELPKVRRLDGYEDPIDEVSNGAPDTDGTSYGLPDIYPREARPGGSSGSSGSWGSGGASRPGSTAPASGSAGSGAGKVGPTWIILGVLALAAGTVLIARKKR